MSSKNIFFSWLIGVTNMFKRLLNLKTSSKQKVIPFPVNKALFFSYHDYDFATHYFSLIKKRPQKEQPTISQLDNIQKVLLFFPTVMGEIRNGGFWQVFFNGYGEYVQASIIGLKELGV